MHRALRDIVILLAIVAVVAALYRPDADPGETPRGDLTIWGVGLGMTGDEVRALHGEPDWTRRSKGLAPPETLLGYGSDDSPQPGVWVDDASKRVIFVGGGQLERDGHIILEQGASLVQIREVLGEPDSKMEYQGKLDHYRYSDCNLRVVLGALPPEKARATTFHLQRPRHLRVR